MKNHLPSGVLSRNVDVWFQDEARIGQQNTISRIWAPKGTRPGLIRQQQYLYAYLYGAACPERDLGVALVLPNVNSQCMGLHLKEISRVTPAGRHAVVIMDRAGYHLAKGLPVYSNLTPVYLPPYSPELNSAEQLWEWLREHDLSNRCFESYEDIVDTCCNAWNKLTAETGRIASLCYRSWAVIE